VEVVGGDVVEIVDGFVAYSTKPIAAIITNTITTPAKTALDTALGSFFIS